jgi:hypothetical protein
MLGIVGMTVAGSVTAALFKATSSEFVALPDVALAYLIGGFSGFAVAVLLGASGLGLSTEA